MPLQPSAGRSPRQWSFDGCRSNARDLRLRGAGATGGALTLTPRGLLGPRVLQAYYLASPVFFLAHWQLGFDLRAAFLDSTGWMVVYYTVCLGLGLLAWRRPALAPLVGVAESSVNFALLILSVALPVLTAGSLILEGREWAPPFEGPWDVLSFLFIGGVLIASFHAQRRRLAGSDF